MRTPLDLLYRWIDNRGSIPRWVQWIFPKAHWCPEMDHLLILNNTHNCFCEVCNPEIRR